MSEASPIGHASPISTESPKRSIAVGAGRQVAAPLSAVLICEAGLIKAATSRTSRMAAVGESGTAGICLGAIERSIGVPAASQISDRTTGPNVSAPASVITIAAKTASRSLTICASPFMSATITEMAAHHVLESPQRSRPTSPRTIRHAPFGRRGSVCLSEAVRITIQSRSPANYGGTVMGRAYRSSGGRAAKRASSAAVSAAFSGPRAVSCICRGSTTSSPQARLAVRTPAGSAFHAMSASAVSRRAS